jgi:hypothetical protein
MACCNTAQRGHWDDSRRSIQLHHRSSLFVAWHSCGCWHSVHSDYTSCDSTAGTFLWFSVWPMSLVLAPEMADVQCNIQLLIECDRDARSACDRGLVVVHSQLPTKTRGQLCIATIGMHMGHLILQNSILTAPCVTREPVTSVHVNLPSQEILAANQSHHSVFTRHCAAACWQIPLKHRSESHHSAT